MQINVRRAIKLSPRFVRTGLGEREVGRSEEEKRGGGSDFYVSSETKVCRRQSIPFPLCSSSPSRSLFLLVPSVPLNFIPAHRPWLAESRNFWRYAPVSRRGMKREVTPVLSSTYCAYVSQKREILRRKCQGGEFPTSRFSLRAR